MGDRATSHRASRPVVREHAPDRLAHLGLGVGCAHDLAQRSGGRVGDVHGVDHRLTPEQAAQRDRLIGRGCIRALVTGHTEHHDELSSAGEGDEQPDLARSQQVGQVDDDGPDVLERPAAGAEHARGGVRQVVAVIPAWPEEFTGAHGNPYDVGRPIPAASQAFQLLGRGLSEVAVCGGKSGRRGRVARDRSQDAGLLGQRCSQRGAEDGLRHRPRVVGARSGCDQLVCREELGKARQHGEPDVDEAGLRGEPPPEIEAGERRTHHDRDRSQRIVPLVLVEAPPEREPGGLPVADDPDTRGHGRIVGQGCRGSEAQGSGELSSSRKGGWRLSASGIACAP